ncbi:MAG: ATP-binding cassette domain-containing protein, partial [Bacteroidales bacterium]|nr:ATP-binding cassette domain-containing protein [Bacteroidales bacterium]
MISVTELNKTFNNNQVLFDINIDFEKGKTNLIIGQSGSGKTVLMKCIIGLIEADSGKILYSDNNLLTLDAKKRQLLRQEMGMLFQGGALFDSLTVEENIQFPLDMFADMSNKEKTDRVNFCLERVNLKGKNSLYPAELSGGMQKRVAIARAVVLNPKYLFC